MSVENKISLTIGKDERKSIEKNGLASYWGYDPLLGPIVIEVKKNTQNQSSTTKEE